jgi:hypothetical protein
MNTLRPAASPHSPILTNGSGAAAILSAGTGCFVLAVIAMAADKSAAIKSFFVFYKPTGPLSGVTTAAILIWLLVWIILDLRWRRRTVALARISILAFTLLVLGFLFTFPPIADIF